MSHVMYNNSLFVDGQQVILEFWTILFFAAKQTALLGMDGRMFAKHSIVLKINNFCDHLLVEQNKM